jgi:anti-sigma B factor antagonist
MPFSVQLHVQQGLTVVGLSGELDVELAADLRTFFDTLVEDRHVDVLVDLRMLTFCDSVGLSALIHGFHACRTSGGSFRVTGDTGLVSRLLRVTGVRGILSGQRDESHESRSSGRAPSDMPGRRPRGWHWASDALGSDPENCDSAADGREEQRGGPAAPHS